MTIVARIKRLLTRSWTIAWTYRLAEYRRESNHLGRPVVVYQMGKVGSTTVYRALQTLPSEYSVYHVHTLDPARVKANTAAYRQTYAVRRMVPDHLLASHVLIDELAHGQPRGLWKVLTLIRDPIARNVSVFFQTIELRQPQFEFRKRMNEQPIPELVGDLIRLFLDKHDHLDPLHWCERELDAKLGIDVYASPFSTDRGWQRYDSKIAELILFRLENLRAAWPEGIASLFGRDAPELAVANAASAKSYGDIYDKFKRRLILPDDYIDEMYSSRFAKHFYSDAERKLMAAKWRQPNGQ